MNPLRLRWMVLALVFMASAINYADRQIIALLKPLIEQDLGWDDVTYGHLVTIFQFATACSLIAAGWFVDRVGIRRGYQVGVGAWSLAAMAHGLAHTFGQFGFVRAALGIAETINSPAAVKTVATWFPAKQRSLAMGIANAAPNIGAIIVPLGVPLLVVAVGWRAAFVITGALGFVWLAVWLVLGKRADAPPQPVQAVADDAPPTPWLTLLKERRTWAIAGAKALSDLTWGFLLFWAPDFFARQFGLDLDERGKRLALVYGMAGLGALFGGAISNALLGRGVSVNRARKGVLLGAALIVTPIPLVVGVESSWMAALMLGAALAAHQAFSTNVFAFTADIFPARQIGSVIGIGATAGTLASIGILEFAGWTLKNGGGYEPMFILCAVSYLLAVAWIHLMVPKIPQPAEDQVSAPVVAGH